MEETKKDDIIPAQVTGAKTDIEASKQLSTLEEAKVFFKLCSQRLLNVNEWGRLAGIASADFKLTDSNGVEIIRPVAQVGDYFKINIPGPGTASGDGYDWVQIESIDDSTALEADESIAVRVRPATSPVNDKQDVAHFFTDEATSSFIVHRKGNVVYAGVHGRNEKPNTKAETALDKTRNAMVALGAIVGFSNVQWKNLVKGIVGE